MSVKRIITIMNVLALGLLSGMPVASAQNKMEMENLNLTNEWDKIFPQSDKVEHLKVTFHNRYGITAATYCRHFMSAYQGFRHGDHLTAQRGD